jgi:DNA gyrase subunit B
MAKYKDDVMTIKKNDIDAIRLRPSMIIGFTGEAGVLHLCKEIIDNNRDECLKKQSPGNQIDIEITDKYIISRDNGRGIPTDLLRIIHETSNAGSSMTRSSGDTAGENGIGSTAYTALAHELVITTLRPQEKKKLTVVYNEGKVVSEKLEDYDGKEHGMITKFSPSKEILDVDYIPINMLHDWLKLFDYTLPKDIKMNYTINGEKFSVVHKPISAMFEDNIKREDWMSSCISVDVECDIIEIHRGKEVPRKLSAKVAFMYTNPDYKGEDICMSWMNMIYTEQKGSHLSGAVNGFVKAMTEAVNKKKKNVDDDLRKDILSHLQVVVMARCNFANMFSAQAKNHVFPISIRTKMTEAVYKAINETISTGQINEFVDIIIANNRVRREGEKARLVSDVSKKKNKWEKPKSFIPCSSLKTKEPKELYIVEGLSAGGGLRGARDARYQAILQCRGKGLNTWEEDISRVLKSMVYEDLINILGCGVGATFDIKKLNFDKIIIATDADIDGFHIRVGNCTFFARWMPEIITAGKLYIAEPPLYKLKVGKEFKYVTNQREYIKECLNTLGDIQVEFFNGKKKVKASKFVEENFNYLNELKEVSQTKMVNRDLLEFIVDGYIQYGKTVSNFITNFDKWRKSVSKIFPELGFDYDSNQIVATIDLCDNYVIIDEELFESLDYIIRVQEQYGLIAHFTSVKRKLDEQNTLGRFFEYAEDAYPLIKDRYKGLGSSPAIVSKETIMDPRTRRLIQVTINDVYDMQRRMDILVGKGKDDVRGRKELLMDFKFTKEDIDN